jgi:HAD superfamily hydrolase (TIGR01484 family)
MKPVREIPAGRLKKIKFLLSDIDDTMTEDGLLPSASLSAIEALQRAGIVVVPITGRPAGWCDHIARMWPVGGVVGENGAFYFSYDRIRRKMTKVFAKDENQRALDRSRLNTIRDRILREVPGAGIASDQDYRIADLAIDFCEDVAPLPADQIDHIVRLFEESGATAKVSSIHVNGWFGSYDKLTMTRRCMGELFGLDIDRDNDLVAFVGDSPNDAPMFGFFQNSVGVANVHDFELSHPPKWTTGERSAHGFKEFADLLLEAGGRSR